MFVTLITADNRHLHSDQMDQIFRLRHQTFNEWLKWGLPSENGREFDKYDESAMHLAALEDDGSLLATWRMMPTTKPYMTAEMFPQLLVDGIPSDPTIWDLSRFAVARDRIAGNKGLQGRLLASMAAAVYEFGMINGIAEYFSVQNSYITPIANEMLGEPVWESPKVDAGATDAALYIYEPSMTRLFGLRTQYKLPAPVLRQFQITQQQVAA